MSTSAIISLIFTIGFWMLFLYVVIRARKKRKARQAEATAQTGISKTFSGRAISSLGRFFSLLFLAVVGIVMILSTVGFIVSDNKTDEVAETGQETAITETTTEAKTYYVKSVAANVRECPLTSCKVINTLPQNTELTFPVDLFDKYPDWAEITFQDGRVGYISKTTLSSEPSSVSVAPAKPSPQESGIFLGEGNFEPLIIGNSYSISFCMPESARSGATCGGLAGETQTPVGGSPPYSLVKGSGFLPPGMSLELNGLLSGAPTTAGTYNFKICAKDLKMNQGCQNYVLVVKEETLLVDEETIGAADLDMIIDSATCVPEYQDDYGRHVFNISLSGTASGPIDSYFSFGSSEPDERYTVSEPYSILTHTVAKVKTDSWTGESRDYRDMSNVRAKGDPATTSWEMRGRTVHLYNGEKSAMTRINISLYGDGPGKKFFKDVMCSL